MYDGEEKKTKILQPHFIVVSDVYICMMVRKKKD
jgi:hypothetical protein